MIYIIGNCLLVLFSLCTIMFLIMDLTESKYLIEEKDLDIFEKETIIEEKEYLEDFKVFTIPIEELEKTIAIDEEEKQYLERFKKEVKSVSSEDIEGRRSGEIQENSIH